MGAEYLSQHHQMNVTSIKTKYKSIIRWSFDALTEVLFSYYVHKLRIFTCFAVTPHIVAAIARKRERKRKRGRRDKPKQIPFREILWALFYNFRKNIHV